MLTKLHTKGKKLFKKTNALFKMKFFDIIVFKDCSSNELSMGSAELRTPIIVNCIQNQSIISSGILPTVKSIGLSRISFVWLDIWFIHNERILQRKGKTNVLDIIISYLQYMCVCDIYKNGQYN